MDSIEIYWDGILDIVRQKIPQQTFDTWFLPLNPITSGNGAFKVSCPNRFFLDWFTEHHLATLDSAGAAFLNESISFALEVAPKQDDDTELYDPISAAGSQSSGASLDPEIEPTFELETRHSGNRFLNPDYTLESFVVGSGSDLAYAAATAICREPGYHFNPLFVHGGVGLGKTHLMHAIGNEIAANFPSKKICCVTAEQFMNDLIFSIQQNKTPDFKLRYRSVDVLLVDDVAFLAGKESTQEEFFHTFNALYELKKQIVLTSDRSPKEIITLEERLRSRFEWGLITDIQPPDLETRIAILKRKVEVNKIYIPDDVIQYIAENITDNIRRLEGALIRLLAFTSLTASDITLEMASEVLSSFFQSESTGPVKIVDVITSVADYFGVSVDQLKSKRRTQDLARYRQTAMYLARELTGASLNQIGRALGNRDHSTVSHACNKIAGLAKKDPQFRGALKAITDKLKKHH